MQLRRQSNAEIITIDTSAPLGKGGEARVYGVQGEPGLAAKVYEADKDLSERSAKLTVMRALPPDLPAGKDGHVSIAWPLDLLCDADDATRVTGFLMGRVHDAVQVIDVYNPQTRLRETPLFDYRYLLRTARNLSAAVRACHARGYVVGDLKHSNVLVTQTALVTLVDTDSFQVRDPHTGQIFACPVRTPDFTPPELQEVSGVRCQVSGTALNSFPAPLTAEADVAEGVPDTWNLKPDTLSLSPSHDLFALATLIFHLVMEGTHPFAGVYLEEGDPPPFEERIARGHFAYGNRSVPYRPNTRYAPPFEMLPPALRELFVRCFEDGHDTPDLRPDARTWQRALDEAGRNLSRCDANPQHFYSSHLDACPWCVRKQTQLRGLDPFPSEQAVMERAKSQPTAPKESNPLSNGSNSAPHSDAWQHAPSPVNPASPNSGSNEIIGVFSFLGILSVFMVFIVLAIGSDNHHASSVTSPVTEPGYEQAATVPESAANNAVDIPAPAPPAPSVSDLAAMPNLVSQVAYSPDGKTIVGIGRDIALWNVASGKIKRKLPLDTPAFTNAHFGNAFAFAPDSKTLAINNGNNEVKLWNVAGGKCRLTIPVQGEAVPLAYSHDGKLLAIGNQTWRHLQNQHVILLLNTQTGKMVRELATFVADVSALHFAPQGNMLVSGGKDSNIAPTLIRAQENNCLEAWDAQTGQKRWIREGLVPVQAFAFTQDGKNILANGLLRRNWNAQSGEPTPLLSSYFLSDYGFAFSPRQDRVVNILATHDVEALDTVTGSRKFFLNAKSATANAPSNKANFSSSYKDGNAEANDAEVNNADILYGYTSAAFSPDGNTLVTGSYTQGAQIWDAHTGKLLRNLHSAEDKTYFTLSGLKYVDLVTGTGAMPQSGQQVTVHYVGKFTDGTIFDSSRQRKEPFVFTIGQDQVIRGWEEGIATMRVGGTRRLTIPPTLAYGSAGVGNTVPPNATLIFDVELLKVERHSSP